MIININKFKKKKIILIKLPNYKINIFKIGSLFSLIMREISEKLKDTMKKDLKK